MRICVDSKDATKRFEMLFLNELRPCIFQKPTPEFTVAGQKFGPFQKDEHSELPNWVIEKLLKNKYVNIDLKHDYESLQNLQKFYHEEEKNPFKFQIFPPSLYAAIARKILRLQGDKTSIGPQEHEDADKLRNIISFLVETRLSKILRVASSGDYQKWSQQMVYEERWLCEELKELLSEWRQNIMD